MRVSALAMGLYERLRRCPPRVINVLIMMVALAVMAKLILKQTAITADAYVTFRVVDNFVHGFGLTWNIDERVQVYTHPLWLFLHAPFYAVWENIFYITIIISISCTLLAVLVTLATFRHPWLPALALLIVPLSVSTAFTDSSILGLENPLSHLLFACVGWVLLRAEKKRFWFWLLFACSLNLLNRLDTVVIYVPVLLVMAVIRFRTLNVMQCFLGSLPILMWEGFSFFYYGFFFPNTKYAKMPSSVMEHSYIVQGFRYFKSFIVVEWMCAFYMLIALVCVPLAYLAIGRFRRSVRPEIIALGVGALCYNFYILSVGGTYLYGRFISIQIFASAWLMYGVFGRLWRVNAMKTVYLLLIIFFVAVKLYYPFKTLHGWMPDAFGGGIARKWYAVQFNGNSYTPILNGAPAPMAHHNRGYWVSVFTGVGMYGFSAGPSLHAVNPFAFTDPLLARLPNTGTPITDSYIYHLYRDIPMGYVHFLNTGRLGQMDPELAAYESRLRFITTGPLWSWERFIVTVKFNLGDFDYFRRNFIRSKQAMQMRNQH